MNEACPGVIGQIAEPRLDKTVGAHSNANGVVADDVSGCKCLVGKKGLALEPSLPCGNQLLRPACFLIHIMFTGHVLGVQNLTTLDNGRQRS